ncbi:MAG TPA: ClbS/DfsB family four-helix bundle protein [Phototrophicaceae bacterium]|nr:ClbS/DfsB family four-helix bundle protein [Phototrophicaceae bacterium]
MAADETKMSKAELLANIEQGWNDFQNYLASLTYEQVTIPADPAGWTAKDHIAHVAIWEDSLNALLEKQPRRQYMGIDDQTAWDNNDWDRVNAIIQQRYHDISVADLRTLFFGIHDRLIQHIQSMSDADLQRPYREFQTDSTLDNPIIHWLIIDTYPHYDEHKDYIGVIVQPFRELNKAQLLAEIEQGWNQLNAYLDTLTEAQLTQPTDAAGWTAKDHIIHLAVWEDSMNALLEGKSRMESMGVVDRDAWQRGDWDAVNAVIYQHNQDLSLSEVRQHFRDVHEHLINKIEAMSDEELQRPYRFYQPDSTFEGPVISTMIGNTAAHYAEHQPWIDKIVHR